MSSGKVALTPEQAEAMRRQLSEHYGDQVRTVGEVCAALQQWAEVGGHFINEMAGTNVNAHRIFLAAHKSSLLGRLLYRGEKLRTRQCPDCKGVWRGCFLECPCGGCGWLPNETAPSKGGT